MLATPTSGRSTSPERIGPFRVVSKLGRGGMATVYLATGENGRMVAVKLIHPHLRDEPGVVRDFVGEAKLAARITHPHVVQVLDIGEDPEGIYLVLEYVQGVTLSALQREPGGEGAAVPVQLAILLDALEGLEAAHQLHGPDGQPLGVVHRDFSPQNILVGQDGRGRLTDFGVAKARMGATSTRTGLIKGKVSYMSPEQIRGTQLDQRCDIWAAGVVAWEIFAQRRLYSSSTDEVATLFKIVNERPQPLRDVWPQAPSAVDAVIQRALAPEPQGRWSSARAFGDALLTAWQSAGHAVADRREIAAAVHRMASVQPSAPFDLRTRVAPPSLRSRPRRRLGRWGLASAAVLGLAAALWALRPQPAQPVAISAGPLVKPAVSVATTAAPSFQTSVTLEGAGSASVARVVTHASTSGQTAAGVATSAAGATPVERRLDPVRPLPGHRAVTRKAHPALEGERVKTAAPWVPPPARPPLATSPYEDTL